MGLRTKFNLAFLLLSLISLGLTAGLGWRITRTDAKEDVIHDAGLLAAQAAAIRGYTVNEIAPLLASAWSEPVPAGKHSGLHRHGDFA